MRKAIILSLLLCLAPFGAANAADFAAGICSPRAEREQKTLRYNLEEPVSDADGVLIVKQTCTGNTVRVQKCAIVAVRKSKVQRWCYPPNRQPYFEYSDVIEYWGAPRSTQAQ